MQDQVNKWTPGPWGVGTDDDGSPGYVYCDNSLGSAVALIYGHDGMEFTMFPRGELEANARLIAAAPELYEALENLNEACRAVMAKEMPAESAMPERMAAIDALAKARGAQ